MFALRALVTALAAGVMAAPAPAAAADDQMCRVVDVELTPTSDLQMVMWVEHADGTFVDTIYITRLTGEHGLGNRPGRMDFNSAWRWPYGRRTAVFPVWAHRHGHVFPLVDFQNEDEDNLSHPFGDSSPESFFCRPLRPGEAAWDNQSCASPIYTDKGVLSSHGTSPYPPRADLVARDGIDDPSVELFDQMNPFDAVSLATPPGDTPFHLAWAMPPEIAAGDYVVWIEVAKEFDHNAEYNPEAFPPPNDIPWADYGMPYRGQPSVVYRVPFTLGDAVSVGTAATYAGYGDPDGLDGVVREPDNTITTTVPGSGASRLLLMDLGGEQFRARATSHPEDDDEPPGAITEAEVIAIRDRTAELSFVAPGDDGDLGTIAGYEIRYQAARPMTEANFMEGTVIAATVEPDEPGQVQLVDLDDLLPQTHYFVGIRAFDECRNLGPLQVIEFDTTERQSGQVDACFVATAAYGSLMANDVAMLRRFRDVMLRSNVLGELAVEAYYTFGPAVSGVVDQSDALRHAARGGLAPLVELVRGVAVAPGRAAGK